MKAATINVLIVGGNGFVGSALARGLAPHFNVSATHQNAVTPIEGVTYYQIKTLNDKEDCKRVVMQANPHVVIYSAGVHDLIYCEKNNKHVQVGHSVGIGNIIASSELIKSKFIYLSSDFVFSGVDGNFSEGDTAIPSYQLGKLKLGGENFVRSRASSHVIIRCAPLLGRGPIDHPSWIDQLREKILAGKSIKLEQHHLHNPVHVASLAQVIQRIIEKEVKNKTLHWGGLNKVSFYELARIFAEQHQLDVEKIEATDADNLAVASDYSLNFTQTLRLLQIEPLRLDQSLEMMK